MSNQHRRKPNGKNYGSKRQNWGDTLSNQTAKAVKRSVETTERQLSKDEIREFIELNSNQFKR